MTRGSDKTEKKLRSICLAQWAQKQTLGSQRDLIEATHAPNCSGSATSGGVRHSSSNNSLQRDGIRVRSGVPQPVARSQPGDAL
jgi:hypothetical protein